jgi:hypothetical protein
MRRQNAEPRGIPDEDVGCCRGDGARILQSVGEPDRDGDHARPTTGTERGFDDTSPGQGELRSDEFLTRLDAAPSRERAAVQQG